MKSSSLVFLLSFLIFLELQGVLLEALSHQTVLLHIQKRRLIQVGGGNNGGEEMVLSKDGHYSGYSRKLLAEKPSETTTSKIVTNQGTKFDPPPKRPSGHTQEEENFSVDSSRSSKHAEEYPDIVEMDYSPARRKPPIHN